MPPGVTGSKRGKQRESVVVELLVEVEEDFLQGSATEVALGGKGEDPLGGNTQWQICKTREIPISGIRAKS